MALIICSECNTPFSEYGSNCPKCGCPVEIAKKEYDTRIEYLQKRKEGQRLKYEAEALELVQKSILGQEKRESIFERYAEKISVLELKVKEETDDFEQKRKSKIAALMEQYLALEQNIGEQEKEKKQIELDIATAGFFQFGRKRELKESLAATEENILKAKKDQKAITTNVDRLNAERPDTPSIKEKEEIEKKRDLELKKIYRLEHYPESVITKETAIQEIGNELTRPFKSDRKSVV